MYSSSVACAAVDRSLFRASPDAVAAINGDETEGEGQAIEGTKEKRCQFWLPNKRRHCANAPLPASLFCGNHDPVAGACRLPCPLDSSHYVCKENLDSHIKRCPTRRLALLLQSQPYYSKGINSGSIDSHEDDISSKMKRIAVHGLKLSEFLDLVKKIESLHATIVRNLIESYVMPAACDKWLSRQVDSKIPYQEKHVLQQASILGNMEKFGILSSPLEEIMKPLHENGVEGANFIPSEEETLAVIEFGAGRGYLTHMLADSYGIRRILMVERRSYKLKADRSLRQNENTRLERLRIDIEDLNLLAVPSLKGMRYLAIGKHLCGAATDLAIRCCLSEQAIQSEKSFSSSQLEGIALATCCHHLCQWKHYLSNTSFFIEHGITKQDFRAITWFSSWAVDADHSSDLSSFSNRSIEGNSSEANGFVGEEGPVEGAIRDKGVEETIRNMKALDRASLGFKCKEIIDMGRLLWLRERGLLAELVKYVPSKISPENHLLLAKVC